MLEIPTHFSLRRDGKQNPRTLNSVASTFDNVLIYLKFPTILLFQRRSLKQE